VFEDDAAALKFFEQKYEEIMAVRRRMNKPRPRKIDGRSVEEVYLDEQTIKSEFQNQLYLTEENEKLLLK
jgi:hypothetical protein